MRLNERARARRNAAREHAERQLADKLGGIKVPQTWLRGLPPSPELPKGRGAVSTKGDPQPRPSRSFGGRA
jgi:hypothetical protein